MSSSRILPLYAPEDGVPEDRRRPLFRYIRGSSSDKAARLLRLKITDKHLQGVARTWRALHRKARSARARKKIATLLRHIRADRLWVRQLLADLRQS